MEFLSMVRCYDDKMAMSREMQGMDISILSQDDAAAYLAAIVESSDDVIIGKNLDGVITSWNPAAERIFGYTAEEAVGQHIFLIIPEDRRDEEREILSRLRRGERIKYLETKRRAKNGTLVDLSLTVSPIRNREGKIIGASKVARDISINKMAQEINAYLGAIVASSDDAIVSKDLNGVITSWNAGAERIFGYAAEEAVGRHIFLIIPEDRRDEEHDILSRLKRGERIDHFETVRRAKNGALIDISITISPIRDASGNIIGASKVGRDISERKRAEEAVRQANLRKDEFLANMSHELRTPMNAVVGLANILKLTEPLTEKQRQFIDTLKLSADNLLSLINNLLDFARLEHDTVEFEAIPFSLTDVVDRVIRVAQVRAREKGLSLQANLAPAVQRSYLGDPLRLQQIITNLVSNAVKFTDRGSVQVTVNGEPDEAEGRTALTITVADTGIGIPQDRLESVFEKFSQVDASISRKYGGSGLGLAICRSIIERMGGQISVESALGAGTTFTATLTLPHARGKVAQPGEPSANPPAIVQKKNILLVEDYPPNVLVASTLLDQFGYDYDVAMNGHEALARFQTGKYDIILMDVQMQGLDGFEATRRIRALERDKNLTPTPIIAMTAHVLDRDKDRCAESGMNDFIPKPFNPDELSQKLLQFIQAPPA